MSIPADIRDAIIERAWDGERITSISRDLGLEPHVVRSVAVRDGSFPSYREMIELQRDAIVAVYQDSGSMMVAAKRMGLSPQSISNTLHARDVRVRKPRRRSFP